MFIVMYGMLCLVGFQEFGENDQKLAMYDDHYPLINCVFFIVFDILNFSRLLLRMS